MSAFSDLLHSLAMQRTLRARHVSCLGRNRAVPYVSLIFVSLGLGDLHTLKRRQNDQQLCGRERLPERRPSLVSRDRGLHPTISLLALPCGRSACSQVRRRIDACSLLPVALRKFSFRLPEQTSRLSGRAFFIYSFPPMPNQAMQLTTSARHSLCSQPPQPPAQTAPRSGRS